MKKKFIQIEVGEDVHWDDELEQWIVSEDFVYDDDFNYWFFCDVSNESFIVLRDEAGELVVDVGSLDDSEEAEDESELDDLLERAQAVGEEHAIVSR